MRGAMRSLRAYLDAPRARRGWIAALALLFVVAVVVVRYTLPFDVPFSREGLPSAGVDWQGCLRRAVVGLVTSGDPYGRLAYNPPWVFVPFIPIALLPPPHGAAVMYVLGIFMFGWAAHRMGARPWVAVLFATSPHVLLNSWNGNIDWIVALGCTLPPRLGLFLVLAKPQLGAGIALFWIVEAWRRGGFRAMVALTWPVALAFAVSFLLYGPYMLQDDLGEAWWNNSMGGRGVAIGVVLWIAAARARQPDLAISSTPFVSPYVSWHGWSIALFGLVRRPLECTAAIVALWIFGVE